MPPSNPTWVIIGWYHPLFPTSRELADVTFKPCKKKNSPEEWEKYPFSSNFHSRQSLRGMSSSLRVNFFCFLSNQIFRSLISPVKDQSFKDSTNISDLNFKYSDLFSFSSSLIDSFILKTRSLNSIIKFFYNWANIFYIF